MEKRIPVSIENHEEIVLASHGQILLHALLDSGVSIAHSCGGHGTCGTCQVVVADSQQLLPRNDLEAEMAADRGFTENERLSCQTEVLAPLKIKIP